jgi:hypothetical protein
MKRLAVILSVAALGGCAVVHGTRPPMGSWAAVQWLTPGTDVVILVKGDTHTGALQTVSADGIVVRGKTGPIAIARSDVLRVSRRETCRRKRTSNTLIDGLVFSLAAGLLVPFYHGDDAKLFGVMAASGAAIGATARTTTYREFDIYVRR